VLIFHCVKIWAQINLTFLLLYFLIRRLNNTNYKLCLMTNGLFTNRASTCEQALRRTTDEVVIYASLNNIVHQAPGRGLPSTFFVCGNRLPSFASYFVSTCGRHHLVCCFYPDNRGALPLMDRRRGTGYLLSTLVGLALLTCKSKLKTYLFQLPALTSLATAGFNNTARRCCDCLRNFGAE